jgi:hypothetical protein
MIVSFSIAWNVVMQIQTSASISDGIRHSDAHNQEYIDVLK